MNSSKVENIKNGQLFQVEIFTYYMTLSASYSTKKISIFYTNLEKLKNGKITKGN